MNHDCLNQEINQNTPKSHTEARRQSPPKARLFQSQDHWLLQLALPNVKAEDVRVEERGQEVYIYAENEQERFERKFQLPSHECFTKIEAELSKGLLTLKIYATTPESKNIEVLSA
mgnify:CR=1 FL=1